MAFTYAETLPETLSLTLITVQAVTWLELLSVSVTLTCAPTLIVDGSTTPALITYFTPPIVM